MRRRSSGLGIAITLAAAGLAAAAIAAPAAQAETVWLCKPGATPDPCKESLETTAFDSQGNSQVLNPPNATKPKIDCFYVYPTVSEDSSTNSDLSIDPEEVSIAEYQSSRYSQRCRVFAPMYRQLTLSGIFGGELPNFAVKLAYSDVRSAWQDYMKHYNHGRGVVLIGHSQGTYMLRELVRTQIDPSRVARKLLVSAILLGGNVAVKKGKKVDGDFEHIPACTKPRQIHCVIAFSTFNETPPDNPSFGRVNAVFSGGADFPTGPKYRVLCTNPAALGGGSAPLRTLLRTEPFGGPTLAAGLFIMYGGPPPTASTPWLQPQDHYTGECVTSNGASVLMISPVGAATHLNPSPDATWGIHLADANIALGNLVDVVKSEGNAFLRARATAKHKR